MTKLELLKKLDELIDYCRSLEKEMDGDEYMSQLIKKCNRDEKSYVCMRIKQDWADLFPS